MEVFLHDLFNRILGIKRDEPEPTWPVGHVIVHHDHVGNPTEFFKVELEIVFG
ncbi:hypothetical protein HanPSC8_Chr11g0452011 [Helianthus annuus]|nr:hypothetical protein HanPSC8_Chr11g0452011 [Helianthus annuus]